MTKHILLFSVILLVLQSVCLAQCAVVTNASMTNMLDHLSKGGQQIPIQLTPEQDAELVRQGILPPLDGGTNSNQRVVDTNQTASQVQMRLRIVNSPAEVVLNEYARLIGKAVMFEGSGPIVTVDSDKAVSKKEAIRLIEDALHKSGIALTEVDAKTIRAEWKPKPRKDDDAQPQPDPYR